MTAIQAEIFINKIPHQVTPGLIQGSKLIQLAEITPPYQLLLEVDDDIDVPVSPDDYLIVEGGEAFSIGDGEPPIIDNPCMRVPIRFKFNGVIVDVGSALSQPKVLGADLKRLDPDGDSSDGLFAELDGLADEPIRDDWMLIIQPNHEFITTPCGNVGYVDSPDGVVGSHLDNLQSEFGEVDWLPHPAGNAVILRDVPLLSHWSNRSTDLMVLLPNGYPMAALDMFYVSPELRLVNGQLPLKGDTFENHLEQQWQRFSWHYTDRKWNPAKDTMLSHIRFCISRLQMIN